MSTFTRKFFSVMSKNGLRLATLATLVGCLSLIIACSGNKNLRLIYPATEQIIPDAGASYIVVVKFEDLRNKAEVGERKDGSKIYTDGNVSDWVSRAIADELVKKGHQVGYAVSREKAEAAKPQYILTGSVNQVWLKEVSNLECNSHMAIRVTLLKDGKNKLTENFESYVERKDLPFANVDSKTMTDNLQAIAKNAAQKISAATR